MSVNKKDQEDTHSNKSNPKQRTTNIFNKVRAMQASQKFSVRSDGGAAQEGNK